MGVGGSGEQDLGMGGVETGQVVVETAVKRDQ